MEVINRHTSSNGSYKQAHLIQCTFYVRGLSLLKLCKLQVNIGPTYLQTLFQRVVHSYDMRINGKELQPKF